MCCWPFTDVILEDPPRKKEEQKLVWYYPVRFNVSRSQGNCFGSFHFYLTCHIVRHKTSTLHFKHNFSPALPSIPFQVSPLRGLNISLHYSFI